MYHYDMVSINLDDSVAQALAEQARTEGLTLGQYLERVAASHPLPALPSPTGDELMGLLDEATVDGPHT